jgi:hypothetical protein
MKNILLFLVTAIIILTFPSPVLAKRVIPASQPKATTTKVTTTKGITTKVRFRGDRRAIVTTFSNLSIASKVDYTLSYQTRGTTQGASGGISATAEDPMTREIIFGTCSHGVCRYDAQITNAKFTVTTTLKTGRKVSKSYILKV